MRRRRATSRKPAKVQQTVKAKRGRTSKTAPGNSPSVADLQAEVIFLTRELKEALEQQAATGEILKLISSSGGVGLVFETILEDAIRLCSAEFGLLFLAENDHARTVAMRGVSQKLAEFFQRSLRPGAKTGFARVAKLKQPIQILDLKEEPGYREGDPMMVAGVELGDARTLLVVPMLHEDRVLGVITIFRKEVRSFTDKQIALLKNFAAQAVIAIENARLLSELRQRTADLAESLEQQTATADVLKVISSSPNDLEPVFEAVLQKAVKICNAKFGTLALSEGDYRFRIVATHDAPPAYADMRLREPVIRRGPGTALGCLFETKQVVHITDIAADNSAAPVHAQLAGARTFVIIPMLKHEQLVRGIGIYRQEVRAFSHKQIDLLQNFAAQAVIAIENTRLLNELRESLQQQTATADVLKVISRSAFDLQTVLQTLVESAARLCEADKATITRQKGGAFYRAEAYGFSKEFMDYVNEIPVVPDRGTSFGRALLEGRVIHIPDVLADPEYTFAEAQRLGGFRTILGVPMLREGIPIGVLGLARSEARPFTAKQIELVSTFADQAAIAIENVRLFDEIQDKSRQLAEASQHKSQFLANMSHELRTPLNAIIGVSEMLREDAEALKQDLEPLDRVLGAGRHLLALINDILDLSKIEAGRMELNLASFSLAPVIDEVVKTIEPLAAKNGNQVAVHCDGEIGAMRADQMRLRQALLNLMSNANKFTELGTIIIHVRQAQQNGRDWVLCHE